jgi:hypothetical protein
MFKLEELHGTIVCGSQSAGRAWAEDFVHTG